MTKELLLALFSDDIFQYGIGFGILFGVVLCLIIVAINDLFNFILKKGGKEE